MCEFCTKHGEGKKWYLQAENYSKELLTSSRKKHITDFLNDYENVKPYLNWWDKFPFPVRKFFNSRQKSKHYGQIVTIEDVKSILDITNGAVRMPCVCRKLTRDILNARCCYGLSFDQSLHESWDDYSSLEVISKGEALKSFIQHDGEGLVHSVWTFDTPYIGALCNCDRDCVPIRKRNIFPFMFRSEYVAVVNEKCSGCRECIKQCQFGAISYSYVDKKVFVDKRLCYGCGVCRSECFRMAIVLVERKNDEIASEIW